MDKAKKVFCLIAALIIGLVFGGAVSAENVSVDLTEGVDDVEIQTAVENLSSEELTNASALDADPLHQLGSVYASSSNLGDQAASLAEAVVGAPYLLGAKGWNWNPSGGWLWSGGKFVDRDGSYPSIKGGYYYYKSGAPNNVAFGKGLDCSGLSFWTYNKAAGANKLIDASNPIYEEGASGQWTDNEKLEQISKGDLKRGDLLFLIEGGGAKHVIMYVGNGYVVHAEGVIFNEIKKEELSTVEARYTNYGYTIGYGRVKAASGDKFNIGDIVRVTTNLNVRPEPGSSLEITDPDYPGYAPAGTIGIVLSGPSSADSFIWWEVDYGPGLYSGWSVEGGLEKVDDNILPTVDAFSVTPASVTLGDAFTIPYTVSDTGGSGLKQVELWRKGTGDWEQIGDPISLVGEGDGPYSNSFYDAPISVGTYEYGMHVVDNEGNWGWEPDPPGPIEVEVTPVNQPPTLSSGYVTPSSGDTSTTFSYYVTYTDSDGDAPTTKYVYVDGSPHTMIKISGSYASGATFKYSTTLSAGSHNYYFYFNDGHGHTKRLPTSGTYSGPSVSTLNHPPALSSGYVTPSSGDTSTTFNYYVTYTDSDGDAPTTKYVYVDGSTHTMTKISGDYTSGATFKYSTTLSAGSHNYYFYFNDGHGHTKRLPTSGTYSGPSVSLPNQPPTLSSGYVTPSSGDTSTTFDYYVTYTDSDGDAPTTKYVYVDGSPHTMIKISGSYASGATFKYSTTLSAGIHNYYFYFNDGHGHTKRLPTSGTYSGPSVSPPTPTLPDLVITEIHTGTIYGDVGVPIDVKVTVTNQGSDDAGGFYVDVYKDLDKPPTPVFGDVYIHVSGLPAGASTDVVLEVTYHAIGGYKLWAQVDLDKYVSESNEDNNIYGPVSVYISGATPTPSPKIIGIDPSQPIACSGKQWLTILGDGFVSNSEVTLSIGSEIYNIPKDRTWFISPNKIEVLVGLTKGTWEVWVTNPSGIQSNKYTFQVRNSSIEDGKKVAALALQYWDVENAIKMVAIAAAESCWNPNVGGDYGISDFNCGGYASWGLWQIYMKVHKDKLEKLGAPTDDPCKTAKWLSNPNNNVKAAYEVWKVQRFEAWSTYKNGKYEKYLDSAREAVYSSLSALPDLLITNIYPGTIYGNVGVPIDIRVTVTNQGSDDAGGFYVDVYKNLDEPPTPVFGDVYMHVSGLPAGASTDVVLKVTYDAAGEYKLWAQVDLDKYVDESNEGNNIYGPVSVCISPPATPTPTSSPTPTPLPSPSPSPSPTPTLTPPPSPKPNQPPTLPNSSMTGHVQGTSQTLNFYVTYKDPDGDVPTTKYVYVDGSSHTMTKISGDYMSGATFKYSTTLSADKEHNYYFYFDDGHGHTVRLPTSGTFLIPIAPPPPPPPKP